LSPHPSAVERARARRRESCQTGTPGRNATSALYMWRGGSSECVRFRADRFPSFPAVAVRAIAVFVIAFLSGAVYGRVVVAEGIEIPFRSVLSLPLRFPRVPPAHFGFFSRHACAGLGVSSLSGWQVRLFYSGIPAFRLLAEIVISTSPYSLFAPVA